MTTQTELLREALNAANMYTHYMELEHAALVSAARSALTQPEQPAPQGWKLVPVEALERWRAAFSEELSAWDIDPPLHHVKASHDEIAAMLAASPTPPQAEQAEAEKPVAPKVTWPITEEEKQFHEQHSGAAKPETERAELIEQLAAVFKDAMDWGRSYGLRLNLSNITLKDVSEGYAQKAAALLSATSKDAREPVAMPFEIALSELIDKICPGLDSGNILDDAKQASAALSFQVADGEMVGHHKVGFGEMPTIHWRDGYWPTAGTKFYTRPQAADAQRVELAKINRYCRAGMCVESDKEHEGDCPRHGITGKDNAS